MYELSDGMQKKAILLKLFLANARIFIFDEPTSGVDIASKVDIYNLMNDLVRKNASIILISSNYEELIGTCDKTIVLHEGAKVFEADRELDNLDKILQYSFQ